MSEYELTEKDILIRDEFMKFLKKHNMWESYKKCFIKKHGVKGFKNFFERNTKAKAYYSLILSSFRWSVCEQFEVTITWSKLSDEWEKIIRSKWSEK